MFAVLCSQRSDFDLRSYRLFRSNFAVVAMVRQLLLLTTAVVAILGQTDVSTCGDSFSTDGKCKNDSTALLQVASVPKTFPFKVVRLEETRAKTSNDDSGGPFRRAGPKHQQLTDDIKRVYFPFFLGSGSHVILDVSCGN